MKVGSKKTRLLELVTVEPKPFGMVAAPPAVQVEFKERVTPGCVVGRFRIGKAATTERDEAIMKN